MTAYSFVTSCASDHCKGTASSLKERTKRRWRGTSAKGRIEGIMTELYHGVNLDGWHVVEMRRIFSYYRGYRVQALFTIDQYTLPNVRYVLNEHFCTGSTTEGVFLPPRAAGIHMDWEDGRGVTVF